MLWKRVIRCRYVWSQPYIHANIEPIERVVMNKTVSPALKALLDGFIDYAGLYPPAVVPMEAALANYVTYKNSVFAWMLRWFVVGGKELDQVPEDFNGCLSVLSNEDQDRAATIEASGAVSGFKPTYCEVALNNLGELDKVKEKNSFAKIRMGGVKPEAIPATKDVALFILKCAELKLPFKATAGLHHPIRAEQALTYEADAPRAVMHGFINVLMAASLAWHGEKDIEPVLAETNAQNFKFEDDKACWKDKCLEVNQIIEARRQFIHSVGSCSFDEPIHDLKQLGWL